MADPEIEELKELVRQNIKLTQDTNRLVHAMRRSVRLKSLLWAVFVIASIGLSVWGYYTYVEPRVEQVKNIYQTNIAPLEGAQNSILGFLKNWGGASTTPAY